MMRGAGGRIMWVREETESNIIGVIAGACEHEAEGSFGGEKHHKTLTNVCRERL